MLQISNSNYIKKICRNIKRKGRKRAFSSYGRKTNMLYIYKSNKNFHLD